MSCRRDPDGTVSDVTDDVQAEHALEAVAGDEATSRSRRPLWRRVVMVLGVLVVLLVATGAALYFFGGMSGSEYDPQIRQQYEAGVASGQYAPVEKHFTIPIPGCTCHSTDPRLTEEHRYRHMNQCTGAGCHG